jgi:hypothetical protein
VAGDIDNPKENPKDYFVRTNPDGNLYAPPVVVDGTDYYDFDYRYGFGIRKLARFRLRDQRETLLRWHRKQYWTIST